MPYLSTYLWDLCLRVECIGNCRGLLRIFLGEFGYGGRGRGGGCGSILYVVELYYGLVK